MILGVYSAKDEVVCSPEPMGEAAYAYQSQRSTKKREEFLTEFRGEKSRGGGG